jgi:hypothetical protein
MKVDVRSWKEQSDMFKAAKEKFGVIHHAFANAGMSEYKSLPTHFPYHPRQNPN